MLPPHGGLAYVPDIEIRAHDVRDADDLWISATRLLDDDQLGPVAVPIYENRSTYHRHTIPVERHCDHSSIESSGNAKQLVAGEIRRTDRLYNSGCIRAAAWPHPTNQSDSVHRCSQRVCVHCWRRTDEVSRKLVGVFLDLTRTNRLFAIAHGIAPL